MTDSDICDVAAAEPFDADTDRVFGALSDPDRRFVLAWLAERDDRAALADLATELAAWKQGGDADQIPDSAVESAHAKLYHVHVPKLADAGLASHDRDSGAVALAENEAVLREHVELPALDA
ncbi:DUF7344 domain-containing protein [Halosimplex amylolyticum]|uniref:DUF7344 domain-containing protein n=1 Tax=Halosimplex amylolyticum TaxID=3396616 RepID=UPI003F5565A1